MIINKRHKFILRFWSKFKNIDNPSPKEFFQNQPKIYSITLSCLGLIYALYYYFCGLNGFLTGMVVALVAQQIGLYIKFKRDWPLSKRCLDWDKVETLSKESLETNM